MKNGCKPTYTTIPTNGTNGSNGSCYLYDGCPADGQVEMCAFQGMPHSAMLARVGRRAEPDHC